MKLGKRLVLMLLACIFVGPLPLAAQGPLQWHGYAQLRYGRTDPASGFSVRRAKVWMKGRVPQVAGLSFKVQAIFRNGSSGALVLQDVFAEYRRRMVAVRAGQFVPSFSLQRSQPDYLIPLVERAAVVEALIPGSRTMGRDIGVQGTLASPSGSARLTAGLFNGVGANRTPAGEGDLLATGRVVLKHDLGSDVRGSLGASLAWRRTRGTDVGVLSTEGASFAGRDVRWGVDGRVAGARWALQGEYLRADLDGEISSGYYALGDVALTSRDEVAVSMERMGAAVQTTASGGPWYVAGYTRFLGGNPGGAPAACRLGAHGLPTKVTTDFRVRFDHGRTRAGAAVQLQLFMR